MAIQFRVGPICGRWLSAAAIAATLCTGSACSSKPPAESDGAPPAVEHYTAPAEGTSSLVQSLTAHHDRNGQTVVDGRLLLPAGTRVWVELFSTKSTASDDPIGRSELYLGASGSFEAGPFNLPGITQCRVQVTSHFSRAWQAPEILAVIGLNGTKLPTSSLRPNNPTSPSPAGISTIPACSTSARSGMSHLNKLMPNLIVSDVERSAAFYRDVLGFQIAITVPDAAPYVFASMQSGAVEIFLNAEQEQ